MSRLRFPWTKDPLPKTGGDNGPGLSGSAGPTALDGFSKDCHGWQTCDYRMTIDGFRIWLDESSFDHKYTTHVFCTLPNAGEAMVSRKGFRGAAAAAEAGRAMVDALKTLGATRA